MLLQTNIYCTILGRGWPQNKIFEGDFKFFKFIFISKVLNHILGAEITFCGAKDLKNQISGIL